MTTATRTVEVNVCIGLVYVYRPIHVYLFIYVQHINWRCLLSLLIHRCMWTRLLQPPSPDPFINVIFLLSHDHIFCLQNIKARCVFISIYQTNPGNKRFFLQNDFAAFNNTGRCVTPSWNSWPLMEKSYLKHL